jgi:hypothetical protein
MGIDEERLKQIYANWETVDLMKAVTIDKTKYEPFAIDIMNKELRKRNVNNEPIGKFQIEHLRKEIEPTSKQAKLPLMWVGYIIAAISFIVDLVMEVVGMDFKYSPVGILGMIYWLLCVYRIHEVLIEEDNSYPITPAKAVWYHLIPFFNFYWIFKWPFQLGKFVNERRLASKRSTLLEISGIFLIVAIIAGRAIGAVIGLAILFTIGIYFNREIRSVIGLKKTEQVEEFPQPHHI